MIINKNFKEKAYILPWVGYSIRNNGNVRICYHANQKRKKGYDLDL
jgi:hypothetical protein